MEAEEQKEATRPPYVIESSGMDLPLSSYPPPPSVISNLPPPLPRFLPPPPLPHSQEGEILVIHSRGKYKGEGGRGEGWGRERRGRKIPVMWEISFDMRE